MTYGYNHYGKKRCHQIDVFRPGRKHLIGDKGMKAHDPSVQHTPDIKSPSETLF